MTPGEWVSNQLPIRRAFVEQGICIVEQGICIVEQGIGSPSRGFARQASLGPQAGALAVIVTLPAKEKAHFSKNRKAG